MPYRTPSGRAERSRSLGHVPLVESPVIQRKLETFRVFTPSADVPIDEGLLTPAGDLSQPGPLPTWIMAFDGSPQEVAANETYPSTRLGYIQVAGVLVNIRRMAEEGGMTFVDPAVIRSCIDEALHSIVMPSSNVCRPDALTVRDSWRREVFDVFRDYRVEDTPLLDTFFSLMNYGPRAGAPGTITVMRCSASPDCLARNIPVPRDGVACPQCGETVFPTDALRLHEEVTEYNPNMTALGRLMSVLEHITMLAYMQFLHARQPRVLGNVAFILDGPLAVFGPQSWFHTAILAYIHFLYTDLAARQMRPPVIMGIEKTGQFAEHALAIQDRIPPRTVMRLPDTYIYGRILASRERPDTRYGLDEYYGRKFFYRSATGQLLTVSLTPEVDPASLESQDLAVFPTLPAALGILDQIGTKLYDNAVIPVALAHSYASIPLRTGSRVLTLLTRRILDGDTSASPSTP